MNFNMNIPENLNQQKLQEVLLNVYKKGIENNKIQVVDFIEEIKKQVISVIASSKK